MKILLNSEDLLEVYYINKYMLLDSALTHKDRVTVLSSSSIFFVKSYEILTNPVIIDPIKKQILLEKLILEFEKNTMENVISSIDNLDNYKLISKVYKHSNYIFIKRVKTFIENNKTKIIDSNINVKKSGYIENLSNSVALGFFLLVNKNPKATL